MHEAQRRAVDKGARVFQETGDQAVCRGQASLKVQLPGHEVSSSNAPWDIFDNGFTGGTCHKRALLSGKNVRLVG